MLSPHFADPPSPPVQLWLQLADELREIGAEYGTTTGRPRRIGWLDMVALKYAARINGLTHINLTKLDVLSELAEIKVRNPRLGLVCCCASALLCGSWWL